MKIKLLGIILAITVAISFSGIEVAADDPLYKGKVVDLVSVLKGGDGKITKAEAEKLVADGKPIAFESNGKIYFIYSEGGSSMNSKLAKYAQAETVGIKGKLKKVNGLNIIISTFMNAM